MHEYVYNSINEKSIRKFHCLFSAFQLLNHGKRAGFCLSVYFDIFLYNLLLDMKPFQLCFIKTPLGITVRETDISQISQYKARRNDRIDNGNCPCCTTSKLMDGNVAEIAYSNGNVQENNGTQAGIVNAFHLDICHNAMNQKLHHPHQHRCNPKPDHIRQQDREHINDISKEHIREHGRELLSEVETEVCDAFEKVLTLQSSSISPPEIISSLVGIYQQYDDYLSVLLGEHGDTRFVSKMKAMIHPVAHQLFTTNSQSNIATALKEEFVLSAVLATVTKWYEMKQPISISELGRLVMNILQYGIL